MGWIGDLVNGFIDAIAGLPAPLLLLLVFLLPAAEAGILIGVFIPGETAVLLGGVAAHEGSLPLWAVIVAAILGAVIGDQVGFLVGRRWGDQLLERVPARIWPPDHIEKSKAVVQKRGALAVLIGRWAAALRAFVPGIAGLSGMGRRSFTIANIIGGATWAVVMALAGYAAGASYRDLETKFGRAGEIVTVVVVVVIVAEVVRRRLARRRAARLADVVVLPEGPDDAVGPTDDSLDPAVRTTLPPEPPSAAG